MAGMHAPGRIIGYFRKYFPKILHYGRQGPQFIFWKMARKNGALIQNMAGAAKINGPPHNRRHPGPYQFFQYEMARALNIWN